MRDVLDAAATPALAAAARFWAATASGGMWAGWPTWEARRGTWWAALG